MEQRSFRGIGTWKYDKYEFWNKWKKIIDSFFLINNFFLSVQAKQAAAAAKDRKESRGSHLRKDFNVKDIYKKN